MENQFFKQYQSPKWQKRKADYMINFSGIYDGEVFCECCCDSEKQLQLHHIVYYSDRKVWEYSDDELLLVCSDCHESVHEKQLRIKHLTSVICKWTEKMDEARGYIRINDRD